jgi:hypothetical protein
MGEGGYERLSVLGLVHAVCSTALESLRAENKPEDGQLVADLEAVVNSSRGQLDRLASTLKGEPGALDR